MDIQRKTVRRALARLTWQLSSKQLTALAGAAQELETANAHYGMNAQVAASVAAAELMDSIVGDLPPYKIDEICDYLSQLSSI